MKKNSPGMDFEAYSERLATLYEYCFESKPNKIEQKRFQIINNSMQIKSVKMTQFAGLNDKRLFSRRNSFSFISIFFAKQSKRRKTKASIRPLN